MLRHNFTDGPIAQPHNAAFVTGFTLNYVSEALQLAFLRNIHASLTDGAPVVIDLFVPGSLSNPEMQNQWIEKGSFEVDGEMVSLRDKRWMQTENVERRIQEFRYPDGRMVSVTTDRTYIPPQKAKELLESAGFHNISRRHGFNGESTQDFSEALNEANFVLVASK